MNFKVVITAFVSGAAGLTAIVVAREAANFMAPPPRSSDQAAFDAFDRLRKKLPITTNGVTLTWAGVLQKEIIYKYRLPKAIPADIRENYAEQFQEDGKSAVCATKFASQVMGEGYSFRYEYTDRNGSPLGSISILPSDCNFTRQP